MRAPAVLALASVLLASCATRIELTPRERTLYAGALDREPEIGERFALVLSSASSAGVAGDMHVVVDGDRVLLIALDPIGVAMKAILREDLLWLRARDRGGRDVLARCEGGEARAPEDPLCRILAALRALRPFAERPLPVAAATAVWLTDEHLVAEGPAGVFVERRTWRRADLACVLREILFGGEPLAVVELGDAAGGAGSVRLLLPQLDIALRMDVLERDEAPEITAATFEPDEAGSPGR